MSITYAPNYHANVELTASSSASCTISNLHASFWQNHSTVSGSSLDWSPSITASFEEITRNCTVPNWDGNDAMAVSEKVISIVKNFVRSLYVIIPIGTPCPEIIPEADGEICLSWDASDGRIFSLSIGVHGKMNYAGQLGKKGAIHGWQPIKISDSLAFQSTLQDVVRNIVKLYD